NDLLAGLAIRVEHQRHRTRAVARGRGWRLAATDSIETLLHHLRPPEDIPVRCSSCLVASGSDDLHAFTAARRRAQEDILRRELAFLIARCSWKRVAGFVQKDHTARRTHRHVSVVFDLAALRRAARDGRDDSGLFTGEIAAQIETVNPEIEQRAAA